MGEEHLRELELASLTDGEAGDREEHLRWCRRCRDVATGYSWLQGEIVATLAAAAETVPVPRPRWQEVQEQLRAGQRHLAAACRLATSAGVVLVVCFMLAVSSTPGTTLVASALPVAAVGAPRPATGLALCGYDPWAATPGAGPTESAHGAPLTPGVVLLPTPPTSPSPVTVP